MKLSEILAKLTGTQKNEAGEETPVTLSTEELTTLAQSLQTKEAELATLSTSLATKETALTEKETTLATKETSLTEKETALTEKETALATKEANMETEIAAAAQKLSVQGAPPVKPETKESDIVAAYQAETDPAKKFALFQKNEAVLKKANAA